MGYPFLLGLFNSIFISVTVTASVVITSAIVGYAVAKIRFSGSKALFNFVIYQMLFPGFMFTVPLYIMVRSFGLLDTYAAMIVPSFMGAWGGIHVFPIV
jgi:multiple sugar transport system permease protein